MQTNLLILRQHINVPKRFEILKEEMQADGIDVLSAMLSLIGCQLQYAKTPGGKFGNALC
jgi:hypothetical protein